MIVADIDATSMTIGLVAVFFVAFPILVHVLIGFAVVQVLGERAENQAYARGEDVGSSEG